MNDAQLVSIVTPSYNQVEFLEDAMRSVLEQDYPHVEYLVIDGGSTDGSLAVIHRYADRLAYWVSEPDRGQAHAINKGFARARGQILGWLNADDRLLPGTVRLAVETFAQRPEIDVVYGRLERIDRHGNLLRTPLLPKDRLDFAGQHVLGECLVNQPGAFWRRNIMERAGLLDESLQYVLDYEFWLRMALAGGRFLRLPHTVAQFRLSRKSKTVAQATAMAQEHLDVIDRYLADRDLAKRLGVGQAALDRQAARGRAVLCLYAAGGCLKTGQWSEALGWLLAAHRHDPAVLLSRRWLALAWARTGRRSGM